MIMENNDSDSSFHHAVSEKGKEKYISGNTVGVILIYESTCESETAVQK